MSRLTRRSTLASLGAVAAVAGASALSYQVSLIRTHVPNRVGQGT